MTLKELKWVRTSRQDLKLFPPSVQSEMGYALYVAQEGDKHQNAKPFKGLGSGVVEIVDDYDGDTYRALYTVRFPPFVYVLHAFQKKAKRGIKTPKHEIDLIKQRLKDAQDDYKRWLAKGKRK